jgi:uncharacterized protein YdaU (DUF1376 family)
MRPDERMPFMGNLFFQSVEGHDHHVVAGYLRALWHYWHHAHGEGLKDDERFLQRLCRASDEQWPEVRDFVFDNKDGFYMAEDGKWHQAHCHELWQDACRMYEAAVRGGHMGAQRRWAKEKKGKR